MLKFGCSTGIDLEDAMAFARTDSISLLLSGVVKLCAASPEPVQLFTVDMSSL